MSVIKRRHIIGTSYYPGDPKMLTRRTQKRVAMVAIVVICCTLAFTDALCSPSKQQQGSNPRFQPHMFSSGSIQCAKAPRRTTTSLSLASKEPPEKPAALGTLQVPTIVGSLTAATIIVRVMKTTSSRLFQQHVAGAAMGSLVLLPAAIRSVQTRVDAVNAMKEESASTRRGALLNHITAHLYLTYAASLSAVIALSSIFYNKILIGKPHFTSLHSRLGLTAAVLWIGAYQVAQIKTWTPMLKKVRQGKKLSWAPQLLWASKRHRQLGKLATIVTLLATATGVGLSGWGRNAFGSSGWLLVVGAILSVPTVLVWPRSR